jgi:arylsulfatase A-like enzyme
MRTPDRHLRYVPDWILVTVIFVLLLPGPVFAVHTVAQPKNFLFFLVDDLGWADVGCFGSQFHETPNIDSLCASGMKFTNGYAACPVCSPTRASIMTGRHPVRVDVTDWIPGARARRNSNPRFMHVDDRDNLALEEVTIAEALKEHGYQTFFAGKWHLGNEGHWPTDQGFDFNIGGNSKGSPPGGYYAPWKNPTLQAKREGEYVTERLTEESNKFLKRRDPSKPFLLYLSYYNVHTPITPYKKRFDHFAEKAQQTLEGETPKIAEHRGFSRSRQDNPEYASMVAAVDDSVGAILRNLKELGLDRDTAVFFFSDNGGLCTKATPGPTSNLPLRSGKGWLYEGGVREPTIIRVPGITEPGSSCDQPIVSMDFFPTILQLAGVPDQPQLHTDGVSLLPLLRGNEPTSARTLYWHYPHYHGSTWTPGASIRQGDWKLIELYEFNKVELYNLVDDPGEQSNLAEQNPAKTEQLRKLLRDWQSAMNAKMPQPNPNYKER